MQVYQSAGLEAVMGLSISVRELIWDTSQAGSRLELKVIKLDDRNYIFYINANKSLVPSS